MRDLFQDKSGGASGIAPAWYKWLLQVFNTLIAQIDAITGLTIVDSSQANLPVIEPTLTAGQIVYISDYNHVLRWDGAAFHWGLGDDGSGYIEAFLVDPTGVGWHLCNGATVSYLKEDGTLGVVTLPDYSTPAYLKFATVQSVINGASGATGATSGGTPAGTVAVGNDDTSVVVQAGVGTTVAADPHQHPATFTGVPLATHTHTPGTLELRNTQLKAWFRR